MIPGARHEEQPRRRAQTGERETRRQTPAGRPGQGEPTQHAVASEDFSRRQHDARLVAPQQAPHSASRSQ